MGVLRRELRHLRCRIDPEPFEAEGPSQLHFAAVSQAKFDELRQRLSDTTRERSERKDADCNQQHIATSVRVAQTSVQRYYCG